jgi:hypothetical protein
MQSSVIQFLLSKEKQEREEEKKENNCAFLIESAGVKQQTKLKEGF